MYTVPKPKPIPTVITNRTRYEVSNGNPTIAAALEAIPELGCPVNKRPLYLADGTQVPDAYATVRELPDGTLQSLGVVGSKYEVIQDIRALELLQPLEDNGTLNSWNAGTYGAKTWLYGEVTSSEYHADVVPGDEVTLRALVGNSHDGSIPWSIGFPGIRVVCQNTFHMAISAKHNMLKLRHTATAADTIRQIQDLMHTLGADFIRNIERFKFLATRPCTDAYLKAYVRKVFGKGGPTATPAIEFEDRSGEPEGRSERASALYTQVAENFASGRGANLARGTWWGAYNAVTEYLSHQRGRGTEAARFADLQWGNAALLGAKALEVASDMASAA